MRLFARSPLKKVSQANFPIDKWCSVVYRGISMPSTTIHLKLSGELLQQLDAMAQADRRDRTDFLRLLVEDEWMRRKGLPAMSETTPDLELLKKWAALKAEEEKKRHTRKIWLNGFVFGVLACSIVSAGIVYGLVMPNVQAARISTEQAIFTATTQRQACEARFEKATVLWDSAAAPPRQIPLFNGLLNV